MTMSNYCPKCSQEFAPDDTFCSNCGTPRPAAIHKSQTMILSQRPTPPRAAQQPAVPFPAVETPAPVAEAALVATVADEAAPAAAPETEPTLPTFWICAQCNTANPSNVDYCENCGALNPQSQPTDRQADPGKVLANATDPTVKLPTDLIAALAAHMTKPSGWRLTSGSSTDVGVSRKGMTNEDSHFVLELKRFFEGRPESFGLYIVADGMGGQAAGEVASRMAIESVVPVVINELAGRWSSGEVLGTDFISQVLSDAVRLAHSRLRQYNDAEGIDAGTTMTACCMVPPLAIFANVGDSRTYMFRKPVVATAGSNETAKTDPMMPLVKRPVPASDITEPIIMPARDQLDGIQTDELNPAKVEDRATKPLQATGLSIERVTRDQSLVQHLMEQGEITQEEVYSDPRRNVILFALGAPDDVPVDIYQRDLKNGDTVLLCSDGLWEMVRDDAITKTVEETFDLRACADHLVEQANQNGGADNVTVVLARAEFQ